MKIINSMTNAPKKYTRYNIFFKGFKVQKGWAFCYWLQCLKIEVERFYLIELVW